VNTELIEIARALDDIRIAMSNDNAWIQNFVIAILSTATGYFLSEMKFIFNKVKVSVSKGECRYVKKDSPDDKWSLTPYPKEKISHVSYKFNIDIMNNKPAIRVFSMKGLEIRHKRKKYLFEMRGMSDKYSKVDRFIELEPYKMHSLSFVCVVFKPMIIDIENDTYKVFIKYTINNSTKYMSYNFKKNRIR
jgi:hypothetical protein